MTIDNSPKHDEPDDCGSCALHARRDFLRTIAASVAGALLTLGASPAAARALDVRFVAALNRKKDQVSYPLPDLDGVTIDRDNEVIVARYKGAVYAFSLSCPHQNTSLKWLSRDGRFQCPKHNSKYQPDGEFIEGRATRGMDRYALRRDGTKIVVDMSKEFEQDKDPAGWSSARLVLG